MTRDRKETIQPGATLFNFHIFAIDQSRAMWLPLERDENGRPYEPFVLYVEDLTCNVPLWQLTWGAKASMTARRVQMPPMIPGLF